MFYPGPPTPPNDLPPSYPTTASNVLMGRNSYQTFVAQRSRVIRFFNLPKNKAAHLAALFHPATPHAPLSLWTKRDDDDDSVWAVFRSHEQALAALSLSGGTVSIATAQECDLEPFHKLVKFDLNQLPQPSVLLNAHMSDDNMYSFTLSSNPPNPRNTFRQGDWICPCAAHNFMRNTVCIACGDPRPSDISNLSTTMLSLPWHRLPTSPRFGGAPSSEFLNVSSTSPYKDNANPDQNLCFTSSNPNFNASHPSTYNHLPNLPSTLALALKLPSILTPSGRAFSTGGKVQNVSADPLTPCVLYWPDNEQFPEQSQIRPPGSGNGVGMVPILNTGNKGPIEQQPGDWVCGKCDYLNWRRRKVCQTCFPYAEGNTDGVSASVQAERIAMLAQVLGGVGNGQEMRGRDRETLASPPNATCAYSSGNMLGTSSHSPGQKLGSFSPGHASSTHTTPSAAYPRSTPNPLPGYRTSNDHHLKSDLSIVHTNSNSTHVSNKPVHHHPVTRSNTEPSSFAHSLPTPTHHTIPTPPNEGTVEFLYRSPGMGPGLGLGLGGVGLEEKKAGGFERTLGGHERNTGFPRSTQYAPRIGLGLESPAQSPTVQRNLPLEPRSASYVETFSREGYNGVGRDQESLSCGRNKTPSRVDTSGLSRANDMSALTRDTNYLRLSSPSPPWRGLSSTNSNSNVQTGLKASSNSTSNAAHILPSFLDDDDFAGVGLYIASPQGTGTGVQSNSTLNGGARPIGRMIIDTNCAGEQSIGGIGARYVNGGSIPNRPSPRSPIVYTSIASGGNAHPIAAYTCPNIPNTVYTSPHNGNGSPRTGMYPSPATPPSSVGSSSPVSTRDGLSPLATRKDLVGLVRKEGSLQQAEALHVEAGSVMRGVTSRKDSLGSLQTESSSGSLHQDLSRSMRKDSLGSLRTESSEASSPTSSSFCFRVEHPPPELRKKSSSSLSFGSGASIWALKKGEAAQ